MPKRANILVVDDNPVNVELLKDMLDEEGYINVHGCTDSRKVLGLAQDTKRDLILLDIRMPYMDGHDVMDQLLRYMGEDAPPVIVLTAQTDLQTRMRSLESGAHDFLTKPFDQPEVLKRIDNLLRLQNRMNWQTNRAERMEELAQQRTEELERLSVEDPLTGLHNRRALSTQISRMVAAGKELSVMFLTFSGLDDLARMNGYDVADNAVLALRDRMRRLIPSDTFWGIWNGYEWMVVHENDDAQKDTELAERLIQLMSEPFDVFGLRCTLRLSIGISSTRHGRDPEQLIRMAALSVPAGVNSMGTYSSELEDDLKRRNTIRAALHHAVKKDELFLLYQPKIDVKTGKVSGAEALLRWDGEETGFVPPDEFIPLAEATGDILEIGDWVIDAAIDQMLSWQLNEEVDLDFQVAVNVSAVQLQQESFADVLLDKLDRAALEPRHFQVEVTETGLMQDMEKALQQLHKLGQKGISIAIDDFGTGYSSLSYLKNLPVSVLKIDRMFVRDMDTNQQDLNLARTVVQMAACFGFKTVAEGVERQEHVGLLKDMGCDIMQGFFYSPPLKPERLIQFMKA